MKQIHDFKSFSVNEAAATGVTETKAVSKKLQDTIRVALALTEEIETKRKAFEKSIAEKEIVADKMVSDILDAMKKMGISQVKMKDAIAQIQTITGKTTYAYKDLCAYMLDAATTKQKLAWEAVMESAAFKTKHEDKEKLKLDKVKESKVNEGLSEFAGSVIKWAKKAWKSVTESIFGFTESVDALTAVVKAASKATPINESLDERTLEEIVLLSIDCKSDENAKNIIAEFGGKLGSNYNVYRIEVTNENLAEVIDSIFKNYDIELVSVFKA